ncbi:MAG: MFS transporter [Candidatus Nanopelagicales bacterium]
MPAALGPILGPVMGGLIVHYLSWPWMFLVNLPLGVVGIVLAMRLFPADDPGRRQTLDLVGRLLVAPGVVLASSEFISPVSSWPAPGQGLKSAMKL